MVLNHDSTKPIYVQIAEWLETEILNDHISTDEKMYSQYQLAEMFNINPATAAKGLNMLVNNDILYKKRGLGMFVNPDAKGKILLKRKNENLKQMIRELVQEAEYLKVDHDELMEIVQQVRKERKDR
ncbi:GntR family transcriptional regulator [Tenuibacillus multivorans]|uniref:DNA-binding transcriptional regulator YhcF, GntR family n=1 Tax=Tenuibacillus multivorans TaxID=237069 RepID=A0A1H0AMR8_9BACI|nr:GntR family transcriptional regulator [Tenuibacillus multivorans]GEL78209.1 GntR family transcriptional regulator [Tenuibacillus multivorans]SDN34777.1 DNA-binding transcriptional regulator YhcF, GntR family [Tenuibacillus multivorans]